MLLYTSHRWKFAIRFIRLVDIDAELAQIDLGNLNLLHQLLMRLRHVIECEDTPAEAEQQRRAEADEQPQGKLQSWLAGQAVAVHGSEEHVPRGRPFLGTRPIRGKCQSAGQGRAIIALISLLSYLGRGVKSRKSRTEERSRAKERVCCARVMVGG